MERNELTREARWRSCLDLHLRIWKQIVPMLPVKRRAHVAHSGGARDELAALNLNAERQDFLVQCQCSVIQLLRCHATDRCGVLRAIADVSVSLGLLRARSRELACCEV